MKIVGIIRPFEVKQHFYVYENGNKIDAVDAATVDEIVNTVFTLKDKYNINQLELVGAKTYSTGISKQIKEAELTKYNNNTLEIIVK
jgi:hypothetical protein